MHRLNFVLMFTTGTHNEDPASVGQLFYITCLNLKVSIGYLLHVLRLVYYFLLLYGCVGVLSRYVLVLVGIRLYYIE